MKNIYAQTQLYKFLYYCNESQNLKKTILDCGAGGSHPPLALFQSFGYTPHGIEISDSQIIKAQEYSKEHDIDLNIVKGDMRSLPFEDNSISFIYSYNSIFHMTKDNISQSISEITRVLAHEGLCFINFLSTDDDNYKKGEKVGEGEFIQNEGDNKTIHTYYDSMEAEKHFVDMNIIYKERRVLERIFEGSMIKQGYIDYIVQKK